MSLLPLHRRVPRHPLKRVGLLALGLVALAGCRNHNVAFRDDDRLRIVRPGDRQRVTLPVTLEWKGSASLYAVFVDRSPMPPGKDLQWLARGDDACTRSPSCPDRAWFNAHGVFLSETDSVTIPAIPSAPGRRDRSDGGHRFVLVPLAEGGRRDGESAAALTFLVAGGA
jgi:hypothetical protein